MVNQAEELLKQANLLFLKGDYANAVKICRQALSLEETSKGMVLLGEVTEACGNPAQALQEYRRALELDPANIKAEDHIGRLALRQASMHSSDASSRRHPLTAILLSTLLPGMGELYNQQFIKGSVILLVYLLVFFKLLLLTAYMFTDYTRTGAFNLSPAWLPLLLVAMALWGFSIYDSFVGTKKDTKDF